MPHKRTKKFKYFHTSIHSTSQIEFPMSEQSLYTKFTRMSNVYEDHIASDSLANPLVCKGVVIIVF